MEYVIIKFYGNEIDDEYHDLHYDEYEQDMIAIHRYANENGRRLFVSCVTNSGLNGPPIGGDVFAEIEYTGTLSEMEKEEYVRFLRKFSKTAEIKRRRLCDYETLAMVKFTPITAEIRLL